MDVSMFALMAFVAVAFLHQGLTFDEPLLYGISGVLFLLLGGQMLSSEGVTLAKVVSNGTAENITYVSAGGGNYYGLIFILVGATLLMTTIYRSRGR